MTLVSNNLSYNSTNLYQTSILFLEEMKLLKLAKFTMYKEVIKQIVVDQEALKHIWPKVKTTVICFLWQQILYIFDFN